MTDQQRADKAMKQIWKEWSEFYEAHCRGPGIKLSMADQMAFYEVAQPVMQDLARRS